MNDEHKKIVDQAFETLDRALNEGEWEPMIEKKNVSVSYHLFEDDPFTTWKGEGLVARVHISLPTTSPFTL